MTENEQKSSETKNDTQEPPARNEGSFTFQINEEANQHPVNSLPASCRRVKLYEIGSSSDTWIDKGTGFCFFDGDLDSENPKLLVSLEHFGIKSLVSTYIKDNTDYSSQNDSIIIWHEGSDTRLYRALSFQNVVGHNACWSYIRNFVDDVNIQSASSNVSSHSTDTSSNYRILPVPSVNSIQKLEASLDTYLSQNNLCDGLYLDLLDKKWLKDLFEFMNRCIVNEDLSTTSSISSILLKFVLNWCGSLELMHIFVSDDIFFDLLKAFEYDLDLITQNIKMEHVKFFKKFVRHHDVVPVSNSSFYDLVHANYRINYLKDVILPRHLDEFSIQRINSTVYSNMTEIMNIILTEENNFFEHLKSKLSNNYMAALFLRELLLVARSTNLVSQTDRNSLILMVRNYQLLNELSGYLDDSSEACNMYKQTLLPLNQQSDKYYQNIKSMLSNSSKTHSSHYSHELRVRNSDVGRDGDSIDRDDFRPNLLCTSRHTLIEPLSLVVEIFHVCQDIFPAIVRSAIFVDAELHNSPRLLLNLCKVLITVPNEGLQSQTREIISRLLDPKNMDLPEKDEICNIFYDKGVLDYLMSYLTESHHTNVASTDSTRFNRVAGEMNEVDRMEMKVNGKLNIMEILSLCAREHKHRFKLRIQSQRIPLKVIKSSMTPYDKFLAVGSIKFIKVCIQMKDKMVNKHLIKYNILRFILWILNYKVDRRNVNGSVLESVCLSLLSTIESIGSDSLVVYLFEDNFCMNVLNNLKKFNSCYQLLHTNLNRIYNNKTTFDENKWFEDDDDDEFDITTKHKLIPDNIIQDNLISLYNNSYDDVEEKWILNKKHITSSLHSECNSKITVKLKSNKDKSLAEEFLLDLQESDL